MFRTFERTWWLDKACRQPGPGRKRYTGHRFQSEAEARAFCKRENEARGPTERGPRGLATEYESY